MSPIPKETALFEILNRINRIFLKSGKKKKKKLWKNTEDRVGYSGLNPILRTGAALFYMLIVELWQFSQRK